MPGRERILLMGGWGVGKSTAAVDIWEKTDSNMYVIDTTYEADRNFDGNNPTSITRVEEWSEYMPAVKKARIKGEVGDWLVIDRMDTVWEQAQNGFVEEVFGKSADEWFLEYRKEKSGHPLAGEYGMNWNVIKKMYGAFMTEVMRFPGNVLVTARAENVTQPNRDGTGGDSPEIRQEYGKFGVKPAGEKNMPFLFHTVLWLNEPQQGQWVFTTVRDRGREQVKGKAMKSFVESYLVEVAGWNIT